MKLSDEHVEPEPTTVRVGVGVTMGTVLACLLSYKANGSILWAIIHGCLSWVYVAYHLMAH